MFAKTFNLENTFQKVAGKNKWHYSCSIVILYFDEIFLAGHFTFGGKSYWVSWASDEANLRNARWNWFTGRNYCRKMCMDMVSFETKAEQDFVEGLMKASNVEDVHNAGRLCDKEVEGCNAPRFKPLNINGWFWASTLRMMPPTNLRSNNVVSVKTRKSIDKMGKSGVASHDF